MDEIAAFLIEKETITGKEFMEILHRVEGTVPEKDMHESRISERQPARAYRDSQEMPADPMPDAAADAQDPAADTAHDVQGAPAPDSEMT